MPRMQGSPSSNPVPQGGEEEKERGRKRRKEEEEAPQYDM